MRLEQARVHFIGIGGIGMCGLAELLCNMGAQVSGSDVAENTNTHRLASLGVKIFKGHQASQVGDAEVVVYSSAVKFDNPEYQAARRLKIPLIPRAEALAEMMRLKRGLAVGGSHGKTTTTSMVASVFMQAGLSPTVVVGGRVETLNSTAVLGQGAWLLAEADESDGSFAKLSPEIAIVTNIDNDHLDHYGNFQNLLKAFSDYALRIPFYGLAIACGDDPFVRECFRDFPKRILYYGFGDENELRLQSHTSGYKVFLNGKLLGILPNHPKAPGKHNALNSLAAVAAGMEAGISFDECIRGLSKFSGVDRRFQYLGKSGEIDLYDDYGHHPTEVRATLQAFRERFPNLPLVVAFQPHRYSRTKLCWDQFLECFEAADTLILLDIYPAGEMPIPGIDSDLLFSQIKHKNKVRWAGSLQQFSLAGIFESDSAAILLTLGAGDIYKLGQRLLLQGAAKK